MKYKKNIFFYILIFILILLTLIIIYGYNSGSCQINKKYICNNDFCLYKEFYYDMPYNILNDISNVLDNKDLQQRVNIKTYPETFFNCAMPNRSGITIPTGTLKEHCPKLIDLYNNDLRKFISSLTKLNVESTELKYPTSCSIIIYDKENDWINWHYDYNYYEGRFFTVLIPITNELTCSKFQFKDPENNIISLDLNKKGICFEGNYVYHRGSKLCSNQKRIILSCQYVTSNKMSEINKMRIKLKDYAFIGKLF